MPTLLGRILLCPIPGSGKLVQKSVKVGSWIVDPSLNSMSSEGGSVRLEPKVMEVLLCLAQHPGETLSKEQLFQAAWPNIIVTEDVLKRCIAELRRAFDDDARNPPAKNPIDVKEWFYIGPHIMVVLPDSAREALRGINQDLSNNEPYVTLLNPSERLDTPLGHSRRKGGRANHGRARQVSSPSAMCC